MGSVQEWPQSQEETSLREEEPEAVISSQYQTNRVKGNLTKTDFAFLKARGLRLFGKSVRFQYFFGTGDRVEFGVTAFKSGGNAVARNYFKRLTREIFRKNSPLLPIGMKLQVLPLLPLEKISYQKILADFEHLCTSILNKQELLKR